MKTFIYIKPYTWDMNKAIELFCGSGTLSNIFTGAGYDVLSIDKYNLAQTKNLLILDILDINAQELKHIKEHYEKPLILWASPPCTTFSVASIPTYWENGEPSKSQTFLGLAMVLKTLELIRDLKPKYWFIENPRGMLRKVSFMKNLHRKTITYCQYGEKYQKPTDIWTNAVEWIPRKACSPGGKCHIPAPRGSNKGVQGLNNAYERGKLPIELCMEILDFCEGKQKIKQKVLK
jgi:hypothetical protein